MRSTNYCLAIVIFIGSTLAQNNPQLTPCDGAQLNTCQTAFNTKMGFPTTYGVADYSSLRSAIEKSFADGQAFGLLTTCEAYKEYQQCYTDDNLFSCAQNPFGLVVAKNTNGVQYSKNQAFGYVKIWNQLDFVCGAGFSIFANAEDCASSVFNNQTAALRGCDTSFEVNSKADPLQACEYVEIAATCYQRVFWDACKKPEVAFWGCNYELTGTQLNWPQCTQIFCSFHE